MRLGEDLGQHCHRQDFGVLLDFHNILQNHEKPRFSLKTSDLRLKQRVFCICPSEFLTVLAFSEMWMQEQQLNVESITCLSLVTWKHLFDIVQDDVIFGSKIAILGYA